MTASANGRLTTTRGQKNSTHLRHSNSKEYQPSTPCMYHSNRCPSEELVVYPNEQLISLIFPVRRFNHPILTHRQSEAVAEAGRAGHNPGEVPHNRPGMIAEVAIKQRGSLRHDKNHSPIIMGAYLWVIAALARRRTYKSKQAPMSVHVNSNSILASIVKSERKSLLSATAPKQQRGNPKFVPAASSTTTYLEEGSIHPEVVLHQSCSNR
ncbi:hypothetical protein BJ165DRAFT_1439916 [Panaeolus papilionaceus]|nr:hypothetical protein BJ165DRAFT_1439916 [Panaeolus papilionaceus]